MRAHKDELPKVLPRRGVPAAVPPQMMQRMVAGRGQLSREERENIAGTLMARGQLPVGNAALGRFLGREGAGDASRPTPSPEQPAAVQRARSDEEDPFEVSPLSPTAAGQSIPPGSVSPLSPAGKDQADWLADTIGGDAFLAAFVAKESSPRRSPSAKHDEAPADAAAVAAAMIGTEGPESAEEPRTSAPRRRGAVKRPTRHLVEERQRREHLRKHPKVAQWLEGLPDSGGFQNDTPLRSLEELEEYAQALRAMDQYAGAPSFLRSQRS